MDDATLVTVAGRDPERQHGVVNPPVYHASTILFPTRGGDGGRAPAPGHLLRPLRHAHDVRAGGGDGRSWKAAIARSSVGSGKTAITSTLLALLRTGDHLLVADTVYAPTRNFCTGTLTPASASRPPSTTRRSAPASPS